MKFRKLKVNIIILTFIVTNLLSGTSCERNSGLRFISVGERIHHDDFEYSVTTYQLTRLLRNGNDTIRALGAFYLVRFKVDNRALRVGHKWDNRIGYIVDGKGGKYENKSNVQEFLNRLSPFGLKENYNTPAGASDSTILAFDIPLSVTKPCLMVKGEILMGDVFDRGSFRRTAIKLY